MFCYYPPSAHLLPRYLRVINAIQNIHIQISFLQEHDLFIARDKERFSKLGSIFGNTSAIRGILAITLHVMRSRAFLFMRPLRWFIRALRRFKNFRTIELHLPDGFLEAYRMIEFFPNRIGAHVWTCRSN